ncbi:MAG: hypothetical protein WCO52_03875 [bacterium]
MTTPSYWQEQVSGATLVSMKVGGPVRYLARPSTVDEIRETFECIKELGLPWKGLGGGSDLVLPDDELQAVLVQPSFKEIRVLTDEEVGGLGISLEPVTVESRYKPGAGEDFLQLHTVEDISGNPVFVEMGASVPWGLAVTQSLRLGFSGLHWFARIPCQVGGAVYNNIHGERRLLSEAVVAVRTFDPVNGETGLLPAAELGFGYDTSVFHRNGLLIISVIFKLTDAGPEAAAENLSHYLEWTKEKSRVQPSGANCGSVFQNITPEQALSSGQEAVSAAWYVDQVGLKGHQVGGMQVFPGHANFIVNIGGGTQADLISLIETIRGRVYERFQISLEPEVELIDIHAQRRQWPTTPTD